MKLEKLLTLSQFVHNQHTGTGLIKELAKMYIDCYKYNNFLKQPLTKEMFVNPLEQPEIGRDKLYDAQDTSINSIGYHMDWHLRLDAWQEAEKKVIFDLKYYRATDTFYQYIIKEYIYIKGLTVEYMAREFNGELTLKNVTI